MERSITIPYEEYLALTEFKNNANKVLIQDMYDRDVVHLQDTEDVTERLNFVLKTREKEIRELKAKLEIRELKAKLEQQKRPFRFFRS